MWKCIVVILWCIAFSTVCQAWWAAVIMNDRPLRECDYLLLIHRTDSLYIRRLVCRMSRPDDTGSVSLYYFIPKLRHEYFERHFWVLLNPEV